MDKVTKTQIMLDLVGKTLKFIFSTSISFYISTVPFYSFFIALFAYKLYKHIRVEVISEKKRKNIFNFVILMSYFYLVLAMTVALYARLDKRLNIIYSFSSSNNIELFNFSLDSLKLFFMIITNIAVIIALTTYRNQGLNRGYYNINLMPLSDDDIKSFKPSRTKNPDFLFIFLIFLLHLILHFLFLTDHFLVFFILFEISIIPIFIIISVFGERSSNFNVLYYVPYFIFVSTIPMILTLKFIYDEAGTFDINKVQEYFHIYDTLKYDKTTMILFFAGFFIPFAAKLGIFPFHTWIQKAHAESSTEGSIVISGITLKISFYGIAKFCIAPFWWVYPNVAPVVLACAMIGAITTTFSMYKQFDIKKIIVYSSVMQTNIALCGFFSLAHASMTGGLLFSFSNTLSSAGLFCAIGYLNDKLKTRNILEIPNLCFSMPKWSFCFFILILVDIGIPGTVCFVTKTSLINGFFEKFASQGCFFLIALTISSLRLLLLFIQICVGIPLRFLYPYPVDETEIKQVFVWQQDLSYWNEGRIIWYIVLYSVLCGTYLSGLTNLLKWTIEEGMEFCHSSTFNSWVFKLILIKYEIIFLYKK